ncbi:hypothetical protein RFI_03608 [Reticulomyxa filosa]|uniref:Uncharacterized protein n=1 Tax=Reticulomyxa filosa TaxID=46433 RepID=X6P4N5_RETFI|nr:hypothetical protein RFI_03608 [Reticulomyxa filosa]|eukprot:ETO33495.1 hypothetical protein RFI_03608 [Reticulomyxa filosa]
MILHFHPSMRRSSGIKSCDPSWISPYKHEREILFLRSYVYSTVDDRLIKELCGWNAKIEFEDEYTQMILLTWAMYDKYIQQCLQVSVIWSHAIDLNLIFVLLLDTQRDIGTVSKMLEAFKEWRLRDNTEQKYKAIMNLFSERRCCNHSVNLFYIFAFNGNIEQAVERAAALTVNGFPFAKTRSFG